MMEVLLWLAAAVVAFELVEHLILPLVWVIIDWRRGRPSPLEQMEGQEAQVLSWSQGRGQVLLKGERWQAVGPKDLAPGEKSVVRARDGLTLRVGRPDH